VLQQSLSRKSGTSDDVFSQPTRLDELKHSVESDLVYEREVKDQGAPESAAWKETRKLSGLRTNGL
jgi:hypothetical protein